jgi:hypothetical protein
MNGCEPWKIVSSAMNPVLQALQFHDICYKFPDGARISHYKPNESFVEGQFNISV